MGKVVIGLGSNLGDRQLHLQKAARFLEDLSEDSVQKSSLYETEPVGTADQPFYNGVIQITTKLSPPQLLKKLKDRELIFGRDPEAPRWSNRPIDMDIIAYESRVFSNDQLKIPHPEYHKRLFVLVPMQEILPGWTDPKTGETITRLIETAPQICIFKTTVKW